MPSFIVVLLEVRVRAEFNIDHLTWRDIAGHVTPIAGISGGSVNAIRKSV